MAETWSIKISPSLPTSAIQWNSGFVSDGIYFTKITIGTDKITYTNSLGDTIVYTSSGWANNGYRTVAFINSPDGTLLTWLNANATKLVVSKKVISYENLTVFKALMDNKYDTALDGKVDKVTTTTTLQQVYTKSPSGEQQMVDASNTPVAGNFAKFTTNKTLRTETPIDDNDCTSKSYVDSALSTKADLVDGKVPASQLPAYVDDVVSVIKICGSYAELPQDHTLTPNLCICLNIDAPTDEESLAILTKEQWQKGAIVKYTSGSTTKPFEWVYQSDLLTNVIYITTEDNKTYRYTSWLDTALMVIAGKMVEISPSLALGETSSTAYPGDKGKADRDAISAIIDGGIKVYSAIHDQGGNVIDETYATKEAVDGKVDRIETSSIDGVYGLKSENSVDPFQTDSVFNPDTQIGPSNIGQYVLQYKTIIGLTSNGWTVPMDSYSITSTSITVTKGNNTPRVAFRFSTSAGKKYVLRLRTNKSSYCGIQYFTSDGTRLGEQSGALYNNSTFTVTTFEQEIAYGMISFESATNGTVTLTDFYLIALDAPTTDTFYSLVTNVLPDTIPLRSHSGNVATGTPEYNNDATPKSYVDDALDGKLDKITTAGNYRLYMINSEGNQGVAQLVLTPPESISGYAVPWYTTDGRIKSRTPQDDLDCANKAYVDNIASTAETAITNINNEIVRIKASTLGIEEERRSDGVYGIKTKNLIIPFQKDSVYLVTSVGTVASNGLLVSQYKTILGINENGLGVIMNSYNITSNSISVVSNAKQPTIAFRFDAQKGDQLYLSYTASGSMEVCYVLFYSKTGTYLDRLDDAVSNNETFTVPTTLTEDEVYGLLVFRGTDNDTLTISSLLVDDAGFASDMASDYMPYDLSESLVGKTMPMRTEEGNILVATPTEDLHAATKSYVDTALDGKLDKVTGATTYRQVYIKDTNGSQTMWNVSPSKIVNTIVQRDDDNGVACNTQLFTEPDWYDNTTITTIPMVNMSASDRLVMLPLNNIIIEESTDGGTTWVAFDSGGTERTNRIKRSLFSGSNWHGMDFPKIDGKNSPLSMLRVTITGMTYDVPEGTAETERYSYWNKDNVKSNNRYCSINNLWFWLTAADNRIQIKVEGASGAAPNTWNEFGSMPNASGWSGAAQLGIIERAIGGNVSQTSNYWNWRFTFRAVGKNGETDGTNFSASTYTMNILSIKGFGRNVWNFGDNYLLGLNSIFKIRGNDYYFDMQPGSYFPNGNASYDFGANSNKWRYIYAQYFSEGGVLLRNKYAAIADLDNKLDKVSTATTLEQAYVKTAGGAQSMVTIQSDGSTPNTIVQRTSTGKIKTGDPVDALDAVNKQSMDTAVQGVAVMVTDLRSGS